MSEPAAPGTSGHEKPSQEDNDADPSPQEDALGDAPGPGSTDEAPEDATPLRIALGFFIVPLLLVVGAVAIFVLFGWIAHESRPPSEYLAEIGGSGINEPWQAAFHLSQRLQSDDSLHGDPELARDVVRALEDADSQPQVRRYLALALGRIGHPAAIPALVEHLEDPDLEVRLHSLWALGNIGDPDVSDAVAERLQDESSDVRTMAAYVLGVLGSPDTVDELRVALNDPGPAVRWNAAVALARMEDTAGVPILRQMLDRSAMEDVPGLRQEQRRQAMLAAIGALAHLGGEDVRTLLTGLRDDEDFRVRQAAREALSEMRRPGS